MRHRAVVMLLGDRLGVGSGPRRVLDVGPAKAVADWFEQQPETDYVSLDLESPVAQVHADVTELPFEDETFDLVVCNHVLEHVVDDRSAVREVFRVLRPGGQALFQVPPSDRAETYEDATITDPAERERAFGQYDHVRICGDDYPSRIAEAGFEVTREDVVANIAPATRRKLGLRTDEPFDLCVKPVRSA